MLGAILALKVKCHRVVIYHHGLVIIMMFVYLTNIQNASFRVLKRKLSDMRRNILTSNMTAIIKVQSASACWFASMWSPLVTVIITLYYVAIIFHRQVCICQKNLGNIIIP